MLTYCPIKYIIAFGQLLFSLCHPTQRGTYFIIAMTIERFYSIIKPHKAASLNTPKRAKITIFCIILFHIIYAVPFLFLTSASGRSCLLFHNKVKYLPSDVIYWLDQVKGFTLPFIALLSMNSVIIHTLRKRSSLMEMTSLTETKGQVLSHSSKLKASERQIIMMLLFVTFGFLVLMTPSCIAMFYSKFSEIVCRISFINGHRDQSLLRKLWY